MKVDAREVKAETLGEKHLIHKDRDRPENLVQYEASSESVGKGPKMREEESIASKP
jgi:hypothetical protein